MSSAHPEIILVMARADNGVIGKDGKILKVFENVKPADHSAEILASF